jgi:LPXTG-motif cell wall-anchored protein
VWPTVGVMGLVLALAASAGVVAWRRRRTEG